VGRPATTAPAAPFMDLVEAKLTKRGYDAESFAFIVAEYVSWSKRTPILTEKRARADLNLCELANIARLKRKERDG
jgi:hypothetical protein